MTSSFSTNSSSASSSDDSPPDVDPTRDSLAAPVRISDIGELLAGLPVLFGFRPEHSLIAVSLEGPRRRLGFRFRMDLPPAGLTDEAADYLVGVLGRQNASEVLVIACSDEPAVADPAALGLVRSLELAGIEVIDAVRCHDGRYWSYVCADPRCCPLDGKTYDEATSLLAAEAVASGQALLPDRQALAASVGAVSGDHRERMREATERAVVAREAASAIETGARVVRGIVAESVADPRRHLTDDEAASLAVWCALPAVRDLVLSLVDREQVSQHRQVWTEVARRVVPPYEPAVLGLAALTAWLSGDGALAWCLVERADQAAAEDDLLTFVRCALIDAVAPSGWEPPDEDWAWRRVRAG